MRLADEIGLNAEERSALFYALLLKDLGCSSNSAKVCWLFGDDDRRGKRDLKTVNWTRLTDNSPSRLSPTFRSAVKTFGTSARPERGENIEPAATAAVASFRAVRRLIGRRSVMARTPS